MKKITLKKRKELIKKIFSSKEWITQNEYKKDCISNFISYRDSGVLCQMDCTKCKIQDYMPLGLEALVQKGFVGILNKQQKKNKKNS